MKIINVPLYSENRNFFSEIIECNSQEEIISSVNNEIKHHLEGSPFTPQEVTLTLLKPGIDSVSEFTENYKGANCTYVKFEKWSNTGDMIEKIKAEHNANRNFKFTPPESSDLTEGSICFVTNLKNKVQ